MRADRGVRVDAVIFDLDGVLLDTEPLYREGCRRAAAELGYTFPDALYASLVGLPTHEVEAGVRRALGEAFPMQRFRALWAEHVQRLVDRHGVTPKAGAERLLAALHEQSVPVALATSTPRERAGWLLAAAGLDHLLPVRATGDEVRNGKPAPDIFLLAARRLGRSPGRCAVIEDSPAGVRGAARAGMTVLLVPDLVPPDRSAREAATVELANLDQAAAWLARRLASPSRRGERAP